VVAGERLLTADQRDWLTVNAHLRAKRYELAVQAAGEYPADARVAGTPLLALPAWLPVHPVPLGDIRLTFDPVPPPAVLDVPRVAPYLLPERGDGTRYRRHCDVVADLAPPAIFENRPTYRPVAADLAGVGPHLTCTRGRFFDGVDVGGAVAHEYAAAQLPGPGGQARQQRLRAAIGDPRDLRARPSAIAVAALTLRHDRAAKTATFPLHWRDPKRVGHAGGMVQVIPVGIFQPSGEAPWNEANDFSLWRGLLREFAEELLGADEDHGSETAPIDYDRWPLAARMTAALGDGRIRAYCLGLGADPLTLAMDLLTVVVIDAPLYDELFGTAVSANAEGTVLRPRPFDEATVTELIDGHPVQAAGAALLTLAVRHRKVLLGALPASLAPLGQVRPLRPQRGVLSVPRVHPGGVGQPVEDLRHHAVVQGREALRVFLRVADTAGEQAVPREQVRPGPGAVDKRDAAWRVADQVDHGQRRVAEPDRVPLVDEFVRRHRDAGRVRRVRDGDSPGRRAHLLECLPVVGVLVRGHDPLNRRVADHLEQPLGLSGGVDQQRLPGAVAPQQVGVVLVRPHGDFGHRHAVDLPRVRWPADTHVSGVGHERNLSRTIRGLFPGSQFPPPDGGPEGELASGRDGAHRGAG